MYTKTAANALLNAKANKSHIYNQTEVNTKLDTKADRTDSYTLYQVFELLGFKTPTANVYTKTETDAILESKANLLKPTFPGTLSVIGIASLANIQPHIMETVNSCT